MDKLFSAAPADGEYLWDGKHHILGYDFWNLRGMLCTADAARALGRQDEAAELVAHGQLELESYPTAAVAHAIASLQLSDSRAARMLALEALWKGPTAFVANEDRTWMGQFTPDGRWVVQATDIVNPRLRVIGADGGSFTFEVN